MVSLHPGKPSREMTGTKRSFLGRDLWVVMLSQILDEIKAVDTGPKPIRNFGITFFFVLLFIGTILAYKGRSTGYAVIGVGVLFFVLGMWAPVWLKAFYRAWMGLAAVLGFFTSRLILSVLFYLVVTPIGLTMRLLGKDLLNQRWDRKTSTYWIKREKTPFDKERYEKQF
jgi:hypothetical protein